MRTGWIRVAAIAAAALGALTALVVDGHGGGSPRASARAASAVDTRGGALAESRVDPIAALEGEELTLPEPDSECGVPSQAGIAGIHVPPGFCAQVFAAGLRSPRTLVVDGERVLVLERGESRILALWDGDGDGISSADERTVLATEPGLNHGLAVGGGHLFASTATQVIRWRYDGRSLTGRRVVVAAMPRGGYSIRPLGVDAKHLYVAVGAESNMAPGPDRGVMVRYRLDRLPARYARGEVLAHGLRNAAAFVLEPERVILTDDSIEWPSIEGKPEPVDAVFAVTGPEAFGFPRCYLARSNDDRPAAWHEVAEHAAAREACAGLPRALTVFPRDVLPTAMMRLRPPGLVREDTILVASAPGRGMGAIFRIGLQTKRVERVVAGVDPALPLRPAGVAAMGMERLLFADQTSGRLIALWPRHGWRLARP